MSYSSISNPNLYNISHPQNRIIVSAQRLGIIYYQSPKTIRPPRVVVTFCADHHVVPDGIPEPDYDDGVMVHVSQPSFFNQPFQALASAREAGPAFEAMLSRLEPPFDLRPSEEHGPPVWGYVAAELSKDGEKILREAAAEADSRAVKEFHIIVNITRRTIIGAELYQLLTDDHDDDDEYEAAVELLKTVTYGRDDIDTLECAICLNDFVSGTQVSGLPCSHWFHEGCIVPWFKTSQTCPMCRFELLPPAVDT